MYSSATEFEVEEIIRRIGRRMMEHVQGSWKLIQVHAQMIGESFEISVQVSDSLANPAHIVIDKRIFSDDFRELKMVSYEKYRGAWLTADLSFSEKGKYNTIFGYIKRPDWMVEPSLNDYRQDLNDFPRSPIYVPDWLKEILGLGL